MDLLDWFSVRRVADGVWRIAEPGHVNCWLVEGDDAALLIDTGLGVASIAEACAQLTALPVRVANTHAHFDHIGGDREFSEVAIHREGAARLAEATPADFLREYIDGVSSLLAAYESALGPDEWFELLDDPPRALPPGFDPAAYRIPGVRATSGLEDGGHIDLGGRSLEVLHTPGHSPDSICLFLPDEGILFTGDTVNSGTMYAQLRESDMPAFARSTARVAGLAGVRLLCMAHHFRPVEAPGYAGEVAEALELAVSGELIPEAVKDPFGRRVLLGTHGRVKIYLPDPADPDPELVAGWSA